MAKRVDARRDAPTAMEVGESARTEAVPTEPARPEQTPFRRDSALFDQLVLVNEPDGERLPSAKASPRGSNELCDAKTSNSSCSTAPRGSRA